MGSERFYYLRKEYFVAYRWERASSLLAIALGRVSVEVHSPTHLPKKNNFLFNSGL